MTAISLFVSSFEIRAISRVAKKIDDIFSLSLFFNRNGEIASISKLYGTLVAIVLRLTRERAEEKNLAEGTFDSTDETIRLTPFSFAHYKYRPRRES